MATAIMVGRDQAAGRLPGAGVLEVDSVEPWARQLRDAHDDGRKPPASRTRPL
jgi:hypothetical protein